MDDWHPIYYVTVMDDFEKLQAFLKGRAAGRADLLKEFHEFLSIFVGGPVPDYIWDQMSQLPSGAIRDCMEMLTYTRRPRN